MDEKEATVETKECKKSGDGGMIRQDSTDLVVSQYDTGIPARDMVLQSSLPVVWNEQKVQYIGNLKKAFVFDIYQLMKDHIFPEIAELCHEKTEWIVNGPPSLPKCRCFRGKSGVRSFFQLLHRNWIFNKDSPKLQECYSTNEGAIIAMGEERGFNRVTVEPFYCRWVHVWHVDEVHRKIHTMRQWLCLYLGDEEVPPMSWQNRDTAESGKLDTPMDMK